MLDGIWIKPCWGGEVKSIIVACYTWLGLNTRHRTVVEGVSEGAVEIQKAGKVFFGTGRLKLTPVIIPDHERHGCRIG